MGITAVPALLEKLALTGCIETVDALHCQVKVFVHHGFPVPVLENGPQLFDFDNRFSHILRVRSLRGEMHSLK